MYADILYLNKQRLAAIEELNKANREKQLLLNRIEKLEAEKHAAAGTGDIMTALLYLIQYYLWIDHYILFVRFDNFL